MCILFDEWRGIFLKKWFLLVSDEPGKYWFLLLDADDLDGTEI
jgi:hypothetical protein